MMMVEKERLFQWPRKTRDTPAKKFSNRYCRFHKDKGHDMEECYQLKDEIERLVWQGYFKELILEGKAEERKKHKRKGGTDQIRREIEKDSEATRYSKGEKKRMRPQRGSYILYQVGLQEETPLELE
ncbi:UNVERIFIED_CONTAM: hypothetical protein Sradi_6456600 [Sesamum radiatum]|uniref:Uncharacterized protein n=1 Tax=Sesamum radiatum TaxID=300843 RepID=A0AAW2K633_SESRA